MNKIRNPECQDCHYYDKVTNFCGVCIKKIIEEVKEGAQNNGNRENENKGC